jgi:hypothetical protein
MVSMMPVAALGRPALIAVGRLTGVSGSRVHARPMRVRARRDGMVVPHWTR